MSFFRKRLIPLAGLFCVGAVLVACQQDAVSKPNFVFKPAPSQEVVAKIGTEEIKSSELVKGIESDLYEAEMKVYELKMAKLQAMMLEKFMNEDPAKKNLSNDEFLDTQIAKNLKISDKEIESFIAERQIPKDQITPEIKERIVEFLKVEAKKVAVDKWLTEKTKKNPVEVYIQRPLLPTFNVEVGNAPFKGPENAKVTIVEFSDFQCPYCSKGALLLKDIEKKYGNKVKIVFKHFPLPFHTQAKAAAEASMCAGEQNKAAFWKMHDMMFADQTKLDVDNLVATAKKAGLKEAEFKACLSSGKFTTFVENDVAQGSLVGIKSTPTFFVNGKMIAGAQPIEVFAEIIDAELK